MRGIGIRWWLAMVFVLIAALTAVLIATVASRQATHDLQAKAVKSAVADTVASGLAVQQAIDQGNLQQALATLGNPRDLALFVFSARRRLVAQSGLVSVRWHDVPQRNAALEAALHGSRFVGSYRHGATTVVSLPLTKGSAAAALIAYAPRPPAYPAATAIFRDEIVRASIEAALIAALAGLFAALLISRRLRRITAAALAIERGEFERELKVGFQDEIGSLGSAFERMRRRLGAAFAQLGEERDRFEILLDQLREGVLAVDRHLEVQFVNRELRALFPEAGFAVGSVLPERAGGLPLRQVASGLFVPGAEASTARGHDEAGSAFSLVGIPAAASGLAVLVVADITTQERLRQAEHDFVSNASHELRTPVSAILGAVEALQNGAADDPESRARFVEAIGRQANRLSRLSSSLLTLARVQTRQEELQLEPVEVLPVFEEVVATSSAAGGAGLRVDCPAGLVVFGQRDVLEQIVSNLVENALKHTADGDVVLTGRPAGGSTVIEVSDHGPGIPAALHGRIFERFYSVDQGRRDGFGLGLAIARDSAAAIGGTLTVESDGGQGTIVRLTLPGTPG